jgi:hypothetical protein
MIKRDGRSKKERATWKNYYTYILANLMVYTKQLGWSVELRRGSVALNEANFDKKLITINLNQRPELRVYALLHELGHVSVRRSQGYTYKFPYGELDKSQLNTNRKRMGVLEEEIAAWSKALDIAKKRKIIIDREVFDRDKSRCLMTYIKWLRREPGW